MHETLCLHKRPALAVPASIRDVGEVLALRLRHRPTHLTWTSLSQDHIARLCGVTSRTVRTALRWLEAHGAITRRHQPIPSGGRRPDLYIVHRKRLKSLIYLIDRARAWWRRFSTSILSLVEDKINRDKRCAHASHDASATPQEGTTMQGRLFQRQQRASTRPAVDPNSTKGRWLTYCAEFRRVYKRMPVVPSIAQTMAAVARMRDMLPDADAWQAAVAVYFDQRDRAVVEAEHPLHWLPRRLASLMPAIRREISRIHATRAEDERSRETLRAAIARLGGDAPETDSIPALVAALKAIKAAPRTTTTAPTSSQHTDARSARLEQLRAQWTALRHE